MEHSIEDISRFSIIRACEEYETTLTDENITRASKLFEDEAVQYLNDEIDRVLSIEKRPHMSAQVVHIRPVAAAFALASVAEGAISLKTHPEFAWLALLHILQSVSEMSRTYSKADGDLVYLVYRGMQRDDTSTASHKLEFAKLWPNVDFDTTLFWLVELGLIEQAGESLLLREKVFLRTPPEIIE